VGLVFVAAFAPDEGERLIEIAFSEPSGAPAGKTLPSWAVVATSDRTAGTDVVRAHAERAGAAITEVDRSHVIMISQPQVVAEVIESAIAKVVA
jgi:hypothetical protein